MRELARCDDVEVPVAVEIADGDVFGRPGFGPFRQRNGLPAIGIGAAERDADVAFRRAVILVVGLVDGYDVEKPVAVDIGEHEPVAAAELDAARCLVVDDVLAPGDVGPVRGTRARRPLREILGVGGGGRADAQRCADCEA